MQYRRLGHSGLSVSALSFGAWVTFGGKIGRGEARELIACAFDAGINFFDNAEIYADGEAERVMGDVLADLRLPRDAWCVSSKVFFGPNHAPKPTQRGLSRKHVRDACDAALKRLRVDYLDLFFCHRADPDTPIAETVWAMDNLVRQGKVLYWGTSEWTAEQIREAAKIAQKHHLHGPTMEQPEYNLLHRERVEFEYASLYSELGLGTTTWSPLASGLLSGKYLENSAPEDSRLARLDNGFVERMLYRGEKRVRADKVRNFVAIARELDAAPAPLAIAWCLKNPNVSSVILGASRPEQLRQNLQALELVERLDNAAMGRIEAAFA